MLKTQKETISNYITLSTQNVVLVYSNGMLKYLEKSLRRASFQSFPSKQVSTFPKHNT